MGVEYDYTVNYPDAEVMTVTGKVLNSISDRVRDRDKIIAKLKDENMREELNDLRLRDKNPTLKDAWDQYQVVLQLTKGK